jgi:phosphoglucosamine mutase
VLVNVRIQGQSHRVLETDVVQQALAAAEETLAGKGRVLLRASGTEPLIRVMVEAQDEKETRQCAEKLAEVVRSVALGDATA